MPVISHNFAKANLSLFNKQMDLDTDSLKMVLLSAFTPGTGAAEKTVTAQTVGDIFASSTEATAGGGYTAGGLTLVSPAIATTHADSFAGSRANSTVYNVGDIVRPATANGFLYQCVVAGTSHSAIPSYGTVVGRETLEGGGTVVWLNIGKAITALSSALITWTASGTIAASHAVLFDNSVGGTPGFVTSGTGNLIAWYDFGGTQTASGGGTFQIPQGAGGLYAIPAS